jgi:hypothetical protein
MGTKADELGGAAGGLLRLFRATGLLIFRLLIGRVYEQRYTRPFAQTLMGGSAAGWVAGAIVGLIWLRIGEISGEVLEVAVRSGFAGLVVGLVVSLALAFIVCEEPRRRQQGYIRSAPKEDSAPGTGRTQERVLAPVYKEADWLQELRDAGVATSEIERVTQRLPLFKQAYLRRYSAGRAHGLTAAAAHSLAESPSLSGCLLMLVFCFSLSLIVLL